MTSAAPLNWREIDAVIAEWPADDSWLRKVRQPDYRRVVLEFSGRSGPWSVVVVLAPPFVRIHRLHPSSRPPRALPKPPRFAAVLKARLEGAKLESAAQLGRDRIIRFRFILGESTLFLDAKLWGSGANLILSDASGRIIDAFSRRPKRGEVPGASWPPEGIAADDPGPDRRRTIDPGEFTLRDFPGEGDRNARVEAYFAALEARADRERRIRLWETRLDRREAALDSRRRAISESEVRFRKGLDDGRWGDILMAHLHELKPGAVVLEAEEWDDSGTVRIPLDPSMGALENAERYYERRKRAVRGLDRLKEDRRALERAEAALADLRRRLREGKTEDPPFDTDPPDERRRGGAAKQTLPGLWIRKDGHLLVVGRSAKESDELLRKWARGNDLWLHARDYPGGHVFVRSPRGKSVPLEVLLDAGNLALSYSKGKASGEADLYYARVKDLRRPKGSRTGTVLPTHEKNLRVKLDADRLEILKSLAETG